MGFIKKKIIRGEDRYYWVISKRVAKKVKTVEYYLGDRLYSLNNLSWYIWNRDIQLEEFKQKLILFHIKSSDLKGKITYYFKNNKIYFKKLESPIYIDLRGSNYRYLKEEIEDRINTVYQDLESFELGIERIVWYLENYNDCIKNANKYKDNTDDYFYWCNSADEWFKRSQDTLDRLLENVPTPQKGYARQKLLGYCYNKCPLVKMEL